MARRVTASLILACLLAAASPAVAVERWAPEPGAAWQWQLQGRVDPSVDVPTYDIDGFDAALGLVTDLHSRGRRVICYISAGSWERWRPDAGDFPRRLLGRRLDGWAGERWLDIRHRRALRALIEPRVQMCARKGFDAVEFDNVDGYANRSGFDLSAADQRPYNQMLAHLAHERGMSAALKNDLGQVRALEPYFDFAINEECFTHDECNRLMPFLSAGKAVLHVEYELPRSAFCTASRDVGMSSMRKRWSLRAWRRAC